MGVSSEEIKKRFFPLASGAYFQHVLDRLSGRGEVETANGKLRKKGHEASLNDEQESIRRRLLSELEAGAWNPPSLPDLCQRLNHADRQIRDVYFYLLDSGEIVRVSEDVVLPVQRLAEIKKRLAERYPPGSAFSVGDFKDLFGISRKFAIPYLEFLDGERITQRVGDQRILK